MRAKCEHTWVHSGSSQCPEETGPQVRGYFCSRPVHECSKCGACDFGRSEAAERECRQCPNRQIVKRER